MSAEEQDRLMAALSEAICGKPLYVVAASDRHEGDTRVGSCDTLAEAERIAAGYEGPGSVRIECVRLRQVC